MRASLRVVLAAAATLAAVQPAVAAPHAHARATVQRWFAVSATGVNWERVELTFKHTRGAVATGTSGAVSGESFDACVYSWTHLAYFYGCGTPTSMTYDIPATGAAGRVKFTLRDTWRPGTAVVDLTLTDAGAPPEVAYDLAPYGSGASPSVTTSRLATAKGTVRITTRSGKRTVTRTIAVPSVPVRVAERVLLSAGAGV
ncbi:MAG TPA: hypothetical protein VNQ77_08005 [Frankiaceae bacterium]|nr:hypothetical protein [Frankiaceae bacterium]